MGKGRGFLRHLFLRTFPLRSYSPLPCCRVILAACLQAAKYQRRCATIGATTLFVLSRKELLPACLEAMTPVWSCPQAAESRSAISCLPPCCQTRPSWLFHLSSPSCRTR